VIQDLVPVSVHPASLSFATVDAAPASLPFPGSLRAKQPTRSPVTNGQMKLSFCLSVPNFSTGPRKSELLTLMMTPADAHPRETSSIAIAYAR